MADAAVPRTRRDDTLDLPEGAQRGAAVSGGLLRQSPVLTLLWGLFALLLCGLLFFGAVRVGAGAWSGRRMQITQIWSHFLSFLTEQGASTPIVAVVVAAVAVSLIGGLWLVWLAMRLLDDGTSTSPEDAPGS